MCGRYFIADEAIREFDIDALNRASTHGGAEIQPGMEAPVLLSEGERAQAMRWGFAREQGSLVINARVETIHDKPLFRGIADDQRCAIPASRYFEWRRADRQKFAIHLRDVGLFYLAGLYRMGELGREFVVLTQPPVKAIQPVHNRMPLILPDRTSMKCWLSGEMPLFSDDASVLIRAEGPEQLQMAF